MLINFSATRPRASVSFGMPSSAYDTSQQLSFTLVAVRDTGISLPDGRDVGEIEISLTLFGPSPGIDKLKSQLAEGTVGFLSLISDKGADPFVHGAIAWDHSPHPYHLFQPGVGVTFYVDIANVPDLSELDDPFAWQPGRHNHLAIASVAIESSLSGTSDA